MPNIVVLIGLPGSGKSTYRMDFIADNPDYTVVSSDDVIERIAESRGESYSKTFDDAIKTATAECRVAFNQAIAEEKSIVLDRTNLSRKSRASFLASLPRTYTRIAHVFEVPSEILADRLHQRALATGKYIPAAVVASMTNSYQRPDLEEFDVVFINGEKI